MKDDIIIEPEEISKDKLQEITKNIISDEKKTLNYYDKLRNKVGDKIPTKKNADAFDIKDFLFLLPDFFMLITRVFIDKRVQKKHKVLLSCIIGYLVMPIDLLPDFIPVIGYIDDFVIAVLGLDLLLKEIDHDIVISNWSGKENLIATICNIKEKIEKNLKAPFLKNVKVLLKTFGIYDERDCDSDTE